MVDVWMVVFLQQKKKEKRNVIPFIPTSIGGKCAVEGRTNIILQYRKTKETKSAWRQRNRDEKKETMSNTWWLMSGKLAREREWRTELERGARESGSECI